MEQPQVLYTPPPQPIVIVQGEGGGQKSTNWFALIIGFLILVIIIMAIVWALAYQRNTSGGGDTTEEGSGTGSDLECPKKISATASTTCKWLRKNSMNTRCLAESKGDCTEEIAKKECAILGKWSALDEGKFVCIFNSNKEITEFGSASVSTGGATDGATGGATGSTQTPLQPTECKLLYHCNSDELSKGAECIYSGKNLKCQRHGICPTPYYNDGGCWMFK